MVTNHFSIFFFGMTILRLQYIVLLLFLDILSSQAAAIRIPVHRMPFQKAVAEAGLHLHLRYIRVKKMM